MNFEPSPLLKELNRIADQPGPVEITKQLAGQLVDSDELTFSEAIDYVSLRRRLNFAEQLRRQLVEGTTHAQQQETLPAADSNRRRPDPTPSRDRVR